MDNINPKTATIQELRAFVLEQIGNTEVFDACDTDDERRDFVDEYLHELGRGE